jgi:hypothetical protein
MADVDGLTLMMAIQAVDQEIRRHELLLTSQTLRDPEEIQSLIATYEKAAERLREAYESEWTAGGNLPPYAKLVRG